MGCRTKQHFATEFSQKFSLYPVPFQLISKADTAVETNAKFPEENNHFENALYFLPNNSIFFDLMEISFSHDRAYFLYATYTNELRQSYFHLFIFF